MSPGLPAPSARERSGPNRRPPQASAAQRTPSARESRSCSLQYFLPRAVYGPSPQLPVRRANFMLLVAQSPCALLVSSAGVGRGRSGGTKILLQSGITTGRRRPSAFTDVLFVRRRPGPEVGAAYHSPARQHGDGPTSSRGARGRSGGPGNCSAIPGSARTATCTLGLQLPPGRGQGDRRRPPSFATSTTPRPVTESASTSGSAPGSRRTGPRRSALAGRGSERHESGERIRSAEWLHMCSGYYNYSRSRPGNSREGPLPGTIVHRNSGRRTWIMRKNWCIGSGATAVTIVRRWRDRGHVACCSARRHTWCRAVRG